MSASLFLYLLQINWPFLVLALLIGVVTGWYMFDRQSKASSKADNMSALKAGESK